MLAFAKVRNVNALCSCRCAVRSRDNADRAADGQIWLRSKYLAKASSEGFISGSTIISALRRTNKPGFRITYMPARIKSAAVARIDAGVMLIAE